MDSSEALGNKRPEEIRADIEATRNALGEKLDALGSGVRERVDEAKQQVAQVREKFSLEHHVRRNPWGTFMGAVGIGMLLGRALTARDRDEPLHLEPEYLAPPPQLNGFQRGSGLSRGAALGTGAAAGVAVSGLAQALASIFDDELKRALGVAVDAVWHEARKTLPTRVTGPIDRVYDRLSLNLGKYPHTLHANGFGF